MNMKTLFPRSITLPAATFLATASAGYLLLSPPPAPTGTTGTTLDRSLKVMPNMIIASDDRSLNLMPNKEVIHYASNAQSEKWRASHADDEDVLWWHDIDYEQPGLCGGVKCFFLSLRDPTNGYLVGHGHIKNPSGYDVALELETKYGAKHFYSSPPSEEEMPAYFKEHLFEEYEPFYGKSEWLVIQPTRTAPEGSIVERCYWPRDRTLLNRLDQVLVYMDQEQQSGLMRELNDTIHVVHKKPELIDDFQMMLDREGHVYHLDLDRVNAGLPTRRNKYNFAGCLQDAIHYVSAHKHHDGEAMEEVREHVPAKFVHPSKRSRKQK